MERGAGRRIIHVGDYQRVPSVMVERRLPVEHRVHHVLWEQFANGSKQWDRHLERKAGGIDTSQEKLKPSQVTKFTLMGSSSAMALIRAVVGEVMRTGKCPPALAQDFKSLRILWFFNATHDEIKTMSIAENIEQHQRKRHTELDNIFQIRQWTRTMPVYKDPGWRLGFQTGALGIFPLN